MKLYQPVVFFLICFFTPMIGQKPYYYFEGLLKDDGLSSNRVNSVMEDNDGFIWIGTNDGLNKFNGYSFEVFRNIPNDSTSLCYNNINYILNEKSTGNLWVGTLGGLSYFDVNSYTFQTKPSPFSEKQFLSKNIGCLFIDSDENFWVGTSRGLIEYDRQNDTFKIYLVDSTQNETSYNNITAIFEDSKKRLWISTYYGIYKFDRTTKKFHKTIDELAGIQDVKEFYEDSGNNFWICSKVHGLYCILGGVLKKENIKKYNAENGYLIKNQIYGISEIANNKYFLAIRDGGLALLNTNKDKIYNYIPDKYEQNSIHSRALTCLAKTSTGMVYIGTYNKGLNFVDNNRKNFIHYKSNFKNDGLLNNNVRSMFQDNEGKIWIGTKDGGGLSQFNKNTGTFKHFMYSPDEKNGLTSGFIFAINELNKNTLLTGTLFKGVFKFDKKTGRYAPYAISKKDNDGKLTNTIIRCIKKDNDGIIWIGGTGLLERYDPKTNMFSTIQGINLVNTLEFEPNNKDIVWVGARGLYKLNKKTLHTIRYHSDDTAKLKLSNNGVASLLRDTDDILWVGTSGGLNKINIKTNEIKLYNEDKGLANNLIKGVLKDGENNLWMSTGNGISKFNIETEEFHNYDKEDGLQGNEFETNAYLKLKSGEMLFGGGNGFNIFNPDEILENTLIPKVLITGLRIFNKPVKIGAKGSPLKKHMSKTKEITFTHKHTVITFEFVALNFSSAEKNQYAYKLDGFEQDWNYSETKRTATYTSLPHDEYVFRVKASNNDGIWNEEGTSIKVIILPPWWKTWWFRSLVIFVVIASALSFYFYRVNALKKQKMILEKKVMERTHELREANSQLEEKQEEILQQNEEILSVNEQLRNKNEEIKSQKEEIQLQKDEIESSKDQLERAFNNITLLSDFGQKLTSTFDFDTINTMIYDYVHSLMDTAAFGIGIYNEKRQIIDFPYFMEKGKPVPYFFKPLSSEKSLTIKCFKNKQEILINDLSTEYIKYLKELPEVQTKDLPASMIHLPLIVKNEAMGTLTVNSYKKNAYDQTDLANLRTLASYISIALDNSMAYRVVSRQKEQITGSIVYGQTIQQAMLPSADILDYHFENFILYRPKDIVSGDFYWFSSIKNLEGLDSDNIRNLQGFEKCYYFIAVVDCTGHGVPGAFMSMIGSRLLNEIVNEKHILDPKEALEQLDKMIIKALRQEETHNHDGMDLGIARIEEIDNTFEIVFAGAKQTLYYWSKDDGKIHRIDGTRRSIGGFKTKKKNFDFQDRTLTLNKGDTFYLCSDGLADQCDPERKKFSTKRLLSILENIGSLDMAEQQKEVENELDAFQKGYPQRDDITLVGVRL